MKKTLLLIFSMAIIFVTAKAQVADTVAAGNALEFNGTIGNYIDLGTAYKTLNFPFSFEAWVYLQSLPSINYGIFSTDNSSGYCGFQSFINTSGQVYFIYGNDLTANPSGREGFYSSNALNLNEWSHIAIVCTSATDVAIYINGISQTINQDNGTASITSLIHNSGTSATIGEESSSNGIDPFDGLLDELRLWNFALGQTQVRDEMCKKINFQETGLIGYWKADEAGTNTTVTDLSLTGANGTIVNNVSRVVSGAPVGNTSNYLYTSNWTGQSIYVKSNSGDSLVADMVDYNPLGLQVYAVNAPPVNDTYLNSSPKTYFGVFLINTINSFATFRSVYNYTFNDSSIDPYNASTAAVYIRPNAASTNNWTFSGGGLNTLVHTFTITNNYQTQEFALTANPETGIEQLTGSNSSLSLFPNPVSDKLIISSHKAPIEKITITDILGQTVYSNINNMGYKMDIDVNSWPSGVYLVQVKTENDISVGKIMVQK